MKRLTLILFVLMLALAGSGYAGKPGSGSCLDIPISWELLGDGSGPEAILSDGLGQYKQGVDGIANSVIHGVGTCSSQTTKDATIAFSSKSRRKLRIKLGSHIEGTTIYGGPVPFENRNFLTQGSMNIRNIIGDGLVTPGTAATYYTKASGRFPDPNGRPGDNPYQWGSLPDDWTCPSPGNCATNFHVISQPSNLNDPEQTAWVKVTYTPADAFGPDRWLVEGTFTEPSTPVIQRVTFFNGVACEHCGQYSFPFRIMIRALAPLP